MAIVDSVAYIPAQHGLVVTRLAISPATDKGGEVLSVAFDLAPNYPNPFNTGTSIRYSLPDAGYVHLTVFNVLGQRVASLVHSEQAAGIYVVTWDERDSEGRGMGLGVCFYHVECDQQALSKTMLPLK